MSNKYSEHELWGPHHTLIYRYCTWIYNHTGSRTVGASVDCFHSCDYHSAVNFDESENYLDQYLYKYKLYLAQQRVYSNRMLPLAILAGIAQALGSVLGKFAFGSDSLLPALARNGCLRVLSEAPSLAASCWMVIGRMHRQRIRSLYI